MDVRGLVSVARAWLGVVVVVGLLAAVAGFVVGSFQPKIYESRATLIVGKSLSAVSPDYNQLLVSQQLSTTYATVAKTRPILEAVIAQLSLTGSADGLAERIRADAPLDSTLLTITVQDSTPAGAAALANAIVANLIAVSPSIQGREVAFQESIDRELTATQDQITGAQARVEQLRNLNPRTAKADADLEALDARLVTLRSTYATLLSFSDGNTANLLSVVEPAVAPTQPISPRPLVSAALAAMLGFLAVAAIAFIVETFDDSVRTPESARELVGLGTLGTVGRIRGGVNRKELDRLVTVRDPGSRGAEEYRTLRTNIGFATTTDPVRTLLVAGAVSGEGRTLTAANLAVTFAQAGKQVILVDTDLRKPALGELFGVRDLGGLTAILRDGAPLGQVLQATRQANLRVLVAGRPPQDVPQMLGSPRMRDAVEELQEQADVVIFDSPPLHGVMDGAVLSSFVDGTLLVIDSRRGRRSAIRDGRDSLSRAGARVLGVVLNRVPPRVYAPQRDIDGDTFSLAPTERRAAGTEAPASGPVR